MCKRVEYDLQETDHGGDLAGSHTVDQFVRVLFLVGGAGCHEASLAKCGCFSRDGGPSRVRSLLLRKVV